MNRSDQDMATDENASAILLARPRLQPQIEFSPLIYRKERWYLLRNTANMSTIRLNESAYAAVSAMDGEHTLLEIQTIGEKQYADDAPTLEELLQLLVQLDHGNFIIGGLPAELQPSRKRHAVGASTWSLKRFSPTAVRIPLWNPERFLARYSTLARWFISTGSLLFWSLFIASCIPLAVIHYDDIKSELSPNFWAPEHALVLLLVYVFVKAFHELSHALAIKGWGGEVREVGIMLLWFFPCPYVDGSSSAFFPDKYKRAVVAAAGVMAELTLAATALLVFIAVEPGVVRTLALDVMLIGTVSTLLANGNPLLKFDGYYVLEDLVEIPNLATRSQRYYLYLVQRYVFGVNDALSPQLAQGERAWFLGYAPAALLYRTVLIFSIALMFSKQYLAAGVAVAVFALFNQLIMPIVRGTRYLVASPRLQAQRTRAIAITSCSVVSCILFISLVPVSTNTNAEGVVGSVEQTVLYAQTNGFVEELLVPPHAMVSSGQPLIRLVNPELSTSIVRLVERRKELNIRRLNALWTERTSAASYSSDMDVIDDELIVLEELKRSLIVRSEVAGEFVPIQSSKLLGRYVQQGQLLAHVVTDDVRVVTAVVTQEEVGRIRSGISSAFIRLSENPLRNLLAQNVRETPGGDFQLPSATLGIGGGGRLPIDMRDAEGMTSANRTFKIELTLPESAETQRLGGRAYVRFDHEPAPIITHITQRVEQLLLRHFRI